MSQDSIGTVVGSEEAGSGMVAHSRRRKFPAAAPTAQARASARARANRLDKAIAHMNGHELESVTLGIQTKRGMERHAFSHPATLNFIRRALRLAMEEAEFAGGIHETQVLQRRLEEEAEAARRTA